MPASDHEKAELRAAMIGRRRELEASRLRQASLAAGQHLQQTPHFQKARTIGAYVAVNGELDPAPVLEAAAAADKTCCLPVLDERHALQFAPADKNTPMQPNRYGIPEPVCEPRALIGAWQLDLIIVPLTVFDRDGNRLGMGAGYYDRALSRTGTGRPVRVGFAHEFQRVDSLEPEPWDIPMDLIVTDQHIYTPAEQRRELNI